MTESHGSEPSRRGYNPFEGYVVTGGIAHEDQQQSRNFCKRGHELAAGRAVFEGDRRRRVDEAIFRARESRTRVGPGATLRELAKALGRTGAKDGRGLAGIGGTGNGEMKPEDAQ